MKLAIIPARGGSKRIPNKNIRDFVGKPLVAYSIEVAKASGLFDKIVVTTDNQEVANIALDYGAEVPFIRPPELSNDVIGTRPVTNHAIRYVTEHFEKPEFCCCIYATAPFLQAEYLKQGLQKLRLKIRYLVLVQFLFFYNQAPKELNLLYARTSTDLRHHRHNDLSCSYFVGYNHFLYYSYSNVPTW